MRKKRFDVLKEGIIVEGEDFLLHRENDDANVKEESESEDK